MTAVRLFAILVVLLIGIFFGFLIGIWLCSVMVWEELDRQQDPEEDAYFRDWLARAGAKPEDDRVRNKHG